jgi:hypothetical protein
MKRNVMAIATGLMLLVAGIASAAPKSETKPNASAETKDGKVCIAGEGREYVDKNASLYTSECEIGNAAFFASHTGKKAAKAKTAGMAGAACCATDAKTAKTVATGEACSPGDACCEVGNAGFFAHATCCGGQHAKMHHKMKSAKKTKESASR